MRGPATHTRHPLGIDTLQTLPETPHTIIVVDEGVPHTFYGTDLSNGTLGTHHAGRLGPGLVTPACTHISTRCHRRGIGRGVGEHVDVHTPAGACTKRGLLTNEDEGRRHMFPRSQT